MYAATGSQASNVTGLLRQVIGRSDGTIMSVREMLEGPYATDPLARHARRVVDYARHRNPTARHITFDPRNGMIRATQDGERRSLDITRTPEDSDVVRITKAERGQDGSATVRLQGYEDSKIVLRSRDDGTWDARLVRNGEVRDYHLGGEAFARFRLDRLATDDDLVRVLPEIGGLVMAYDEERTKVRLLDRDRDDRALAS